MAGVAGGVNMDGHTVKRYRVFVPNSGHPAFYVLATSELAESTRGRGPVVVNFP